MKSQFREFLFEAKHRTGLLVAAATVAVPFTWKLVPLDKSGPFRVRRCRHSAGAVK